LRSSEAFPGYHYIEKLSASVVCFADFEDLWKEHVLLSAFIKIFAEIIIPSVGRRMKMTITSTID
jgi:hypothetical protein